MRIVYNKVREYGYYAIVCPHCNRILASASEREWLLEFSSCDCDERDKLAKLGGVSHV